MLSGVKEAEAPKKKRRRSLEWMVVMGVLIWVGVGFGMSRFLPINDKQDCMELGACDLVDAVVVISGGNTGVRVMGGVEMFKMGITGMMVMSGAAADKTGPSNAAVMRNMAIEAGIPAERILIEDRSENTRENADFVARVLRDSEIESIILVTSAYHQRRAYLEFRRALGEEAVILNYTAPGERSDSLWWWFTPGGFVMGLREMVGVGAFYLRN